ncbi:MULTISPECIES: BTAD domain-containing putative transcriptional regulator [Actinosynnema]|uniref:AfsR/SARP family transcriptional regulator n=1 Tax=Actinosynnema TaxID=40566 RepID=UPI0026464BE2|nr:BTAD domain-containing putative transcriptional regulator [Actinosynnema pretiosum]MCP2097726.1 putative ATPase [Actinosynnema pretiosum]
MRFGILGPLAVHATDGRSVTVPQVKVRALLADLLVHEEAVVSTDRLVEDLWGDAPPSSPSALHTKVWRLRRAFEEAEPGSGALLVSRAPGYLLAAQPETVDARRFLALVRQSARSSPPRTKAALLGDALALWRGAALTDFADQEFARPTIARLEEQRLAAWEQYAEIRLELGEHAQLVGELDDLVRANPLRERLRAAHMRALYLSGRQSEALGSFDDMRATLSRELGLRPGPELAELRQAVLERRLEPASRAESITARASAGPGTNLPGQLTDLIGRDGAKVQVRSLLEAGRLVTLSGIGGVGKTRVALAVGGAMADTFSDGVWLAELGTVPPPTCSDDEDVRFHELCELVAAALGVRDAPTATGAHAGGPVSLADRLTDSLRSKQMLLVLDNCEHLVGPAARLAETLLRAAPGLRVLTTSREPLGITGERVWSLPPLALPRQDADLAELSRSDAVRLFLARAVEAAPDFALDERNAEAVRTICLRLDGIPFALELAAKRVRALGVDEIAARLADRFTLLASGARGAPTRQQTLRGALDWSWDLLTEPERAVLRRMSVMRGGCALDAVERVCAGADLDAARVTDVLARLVDRSLVAMADTPSGRRYHLLESVAAYGAERLDEAGETEDTQHAHLVHHVELLERALPVLRGTGQRDRLQALDRESANTRHALGTAVRQGRAALALRLVNSAAWYWFLRGRLDEAVRSLSAALGAAGDAEPDDRAVAVAWQTGFALRTGDPTFPPERGDEVLRSLESVADPNRRALATWFVGFAQTGFGEHATTVESVLRGLRLFRETGDEWGVAAALGTLATLAILQGDLAALEQHAQRSASLFESLGDAWGLLYATGPLAQLAETKGDYALAARLHGEGLRLAEAFGLRTEASLKLSGLGRIALLTEEHDRARELHERAARLASEDGYRYGVQFAEVGLGLVHRRAGDLDAAEPHLRRWLEWCRKLGGDVGAALILAELGFIAELRGDAESALRLHEEGFAAARSAGDPRAVALALEGLAGACAASGRAGVAAVLLGAAATLREDVGAVLPRAERGDVDRVSASASAALGPEAFQALLAEGRDLDAEEARQRAVSMVSPSVEPGR